MNEWITPIATLIICVVLPYVVNLCKKTQWSKEVKRWLAIGVSVLVGVATGIISGIPTPATFVTWILAVIGGVQVAYTLFKNIGITSGWLDALEGIGSSTDSSAKIK